MEQGHDIVVLGASMGGVQALQSLFRQLPGDLPASLFVVQHTHRTSSGALGQRLGQGGALQSAMAADGDPIRQGRIYVAPPDHHLLVKDGIVRLSRGPRENRVRPSIDALFRSAAVTYGPRTVGVVLSGLLDDGAAGLSAVTHCGGVGVVQDPADAAFPEMPQAALDEDSPDYTVPLAEMGALLERLVHEPAGPPVPVPTDLALEARIAEAVSGTMMPAESWGEVTDLTCPDCDGPIRELRRGRQHRYRCMVGHAFGEEGLLQGQSEEIDRVLWECVRHFEERARLLGRLADRSRAADRNWSVADFERQQGESRRNAQVIKSLLAERLR